MAEKDRTEASKLRYVSKAPEPITPLRGTGSSRFSSPEITQTPPDFPSHYPNELNLRTAVIRTKAVRKFPEQRQILELCKYFITEMTPLFCEAVKAGTTRADLVLGDSGMWGLLHSLLVYNCKYDNERYQLEQDLRRSDEWSEFEKATAKAQAESSRAHYSANAAQSHRNAEAELGDVLTAIGGRRGSGGWVSAALGNGVKDKLFAHSEDYRTVSVHGETYTLTSEQAAMIQILHKAHKNGTPDISIAHILEELNKKNSRWQDTFKSNPTAKRALVRSGNRKGTLRLKL
jgi:hypothetical protein